MTQEILDFDYYLDNPDVYEIQKAIDNELDSIEVDKKRYKRRVAKEKNPLAEKPKDKFDLRNIGTALEGNARARLEHYLKKSPQYKVLDEQLILLKAEYDNYKRIGNKELMEKTQEIIKDLQYKKFKVVKIYKNENNNKLTAETAEKLKNSPKMNELKAKRKGLETAIKMNNPNSLVVRLINLRNDLDINSIAGIEDYFDDQEIEDIEDYFDEDDSKTTPQSSKREYNELCTHIGEIIGQSASEVSNMTPTEIRKQLKLFAPDLEDVKEALEEVKIEIGNETAAISGKEDITSIIFDIFDFEEEGIEQEPKEMLAAANVKYVRAIAYNMCRSRNMLHYLDDATAYGLLGLTNAINKWYNIQKFRDSAITFTGIANKTIAFEISRGLYALTTSSASGSTMANMVAKRNRQINNFMKNNPELKDLPKEIIESMLETVIEDRPAEIISESKYSSIVGGEDGGGDADIWANKLVQEVNDFNIGVLDSLKKLFGLFDIGSKPLKGIEKTTNQVRVIFDKLDYKLFKLVFGLEFKREISETGAPVNVNYSQSEIGKILVEYARSNNLVIGKDSTSKRGFISQSAVNTRIQNLKTKLGKAIELYPEIEIGLQYIVMNEFSNALENVTNKYEQDMFVDDYDLSNQRFQADLESDKNLSDLVDNDDDSDDFSSEFEDDYDSDDFEDEIANQFDDEIL